MNRDGFIALFFGGCSPENAIKICSVYSIDEYNIALTMPDFIEFRENQTKNFCEGCEGMLLGKLFILSDAISTLSPSDKNYPALFREYHRLLTLTSPIIEKLARISKETQTFDELELVIRDV
jgi:hypothetical protein